MSRVIEIRVMDSHTLVKQHVSPGTLSTSVAMRIAPAPKYILAPLKLLAQAYKNCCIIIVLNEYW